MTIISCNNCMAVWDVPFAPTGSPGGPQYNCGCGKELRAPGDFMLVPQENDDADRHGMREGLPVSGYKPQSDANVQLVNEFKEMEERVLRMCDEISNIVGAGHEHWLDNGVHDIQTGFMKVNRSIFQPERIALPEDRADNEEKTSG